jgi:ABC-type transport system involved in cytochrome bd biosynthesis fused ATPase/permease subunit
MPKSLGNWGFPQRSDRKKTFQQLTSSAVQDDAAGEQYIRELRLISSAAPKVNLEKEDSTLSFLKRDIDLEHANMVAVVMGPSGAGKSRFIAEASGIETGVGDSLHSGMCLSPSHLDHLTRRNDDS